MVKRFKTTKYHTKTIKLLGSKIWNHIPPNIKFETTFQYFKEFIETWLGPKYICDVNF